MSFEVGVARMNSRLFVSLQAAWVAVVCVCSALGPVSAQTTTQDIVTVRASGAALLILDATPDVRSILQAKLSDPAANARLAHDAVLAIVGSKGVLHDVTSLTVRIVYTKLGEFNPDYKAVAFAGVERYATLTLSGSDYKANRDKLASLAEGSPLPAWLQFKVIGQLPPR